MLGASEHVAERFGGGGAHLFFWFFWQKMFLGGFASPPRWHHERSFIYGHADATRLSVQRVRGGVVRDISSRIGNRVPFHDDGGVPCVVVSSPRLNPGKRGKNFQFWLFFGKIFTGGTLHWQRRRRGGGCAPYGCGNSDETGLSMAEGLLYTRAVLSSIGKGNSLSLQIFGVGTLTRRT